MDGDRTSLPGGELSRPQDLITFTQDVARDGWDLGELSDLDRRIIVALQQNGRASWTSVADVVGSSLATVSRRGQQLLNDGVVRVTVQPAIGSHGPTDLFLTRINCRPGAQIDVARQLMAWESVRFVTVVSGKYDIVAEVAVRGGASHYVQLISPLQLIEGVERWRSDLLLHIYKVGHDWSRQLFAYRLPDAEGPIASPGSEPHDRCRPSHFDEVDWQLVALLAADGRATFPKIAAGLGLNESSVRRRFERLRNEGCVDVLTLVSAPALGMGAETLLTVQVRPGRLSDVARKLVQYPAVRYLAATLDSNSLFCEVIASSNGSLWSFINDTLATLDGVEGWDASMELLQLKRGFAETPWWRRQSRLTHVDRG